MAENRETEKFWAGPFGDEYTRRNSGAAAEAIALRRNAWSMQKLSSEPRNVIELGANRGLNLIALKRLFPDIECSAVEINAEACGELKSLGVEVFNTSILEFNGDRKWDLVLISGVLIHIDPSDLPTAYLQMSSLSNRWVLMREYHSPYPVEVEYRGHHSRLWKRDFAGEFLKTNPEFKLKDCGFAYQGDAYYGGEDLHFFLFEKYPRQLS